MFYLSNKNSAPDCLDIFLHKIDPTRIHLLCEFEDKSYNSTRISCVLTRQIKGLYTHAKKKGNTVVLLK